MTTALSFPDFDCFKVAPLSFSSPCACPLRLSSSKPLPLPPAHRLHFIFLHGQKGPLRINNRSGLARRHIVAVAHAEPDRIDGKEPQQVLSLNSVILKIGNLLFYLSLSIWLCFICLFIVFAEVVNLGKFL